MPDFRLTAIARAEILDIVSYGLEEFGPSVSETYVKGLYDLFDRLAQQPAIGRALTGAYPNARRHPYRRHVVVYEVTTFGILVVRIAPMARLRDPDGVPD